MRDPPPEPPVGWNAKEQLREAVNRLVLYEVLCKPEPDPSNKNDNKKYTYTFHPEFANYMNRHVQRMKRSPEERATFDEMVKGYGGIGKSEEFSWFDSGEFSYIFWFILPGYLAIRKYFEMLRAPQVGGQTREEVAKYFHELGGADNWTEDHWVELMRAIMPKDEISEEIADIVKTDYWTNKDKWNELHVMAEIVYSKLVAEGKDIAKLIE